MKSFALTNRRSFVQIAAVAGSGLLLGRNTIHGAENNNNNDKDVEVSPAEDLMREHGVLKRVLLIYQEGIRRIRANEDFPNQSINNAAEIIRDFIENYHEKLEENYLFPRFRKAGKLVDLVQILNDQHQAGRNVTRIILQYASQPSVTGTEDRQKWAFAMEQFVRMYAPHEAREDTVLFPAFRQIVSENEYDSLGEDFEKEENRLFGENGFEKMVDRVAGIEKTLGIYDLAKFTPQAQS